jgi:hypothetical protein
LGGRSNKSIVKDIVEDCVIVKINGIYTCRRFHSARRETPDLQKAIIGRERYTHYSLRCFCRKGLTSPWIIRWMHRRTFVHSHRDLWSLLLFFLRLPCLCIMIGLLDVEQEAGVQRISAAKQDYMVE